MTGFLILLHTIISVLLISVILMQASQGGGLSGTFGGQAASSILGGQSAGNVLSKITTWFAVIFLSLAILISLLSGPKSGTSTSVVKQAAEERPIFPETETVLPKKAEATRSTVQRTLFQPLSRRLLEAAKRKGSQKTVFQTSRNRSRNGQGGLPLRRASEGRGRGLGLP